MKRIKAFLTGLGIGTCCGMCMTMLWLHRAMLVALIKGEKLPEAPEGCPAFRKESNT